MIVRALTQWLLQEAGGSEARRDDHTSGRTHAIKLVMALEMHNDFRWLVNRTVSWDNTEHTSIYSIAVD